MIIQSPQRGRINEIGQVAYLDGGCFWLANDDILTIYNRLYLFNLDLKHQKSTIKPYSLPIPLERHKRMGEGCLLGCMAALGKVIKQTGKAVSLLREIDFEQLIFYKQPKPPIYKE